MRYRSYYYDAETGYYYLQSRYYEPEICRFINSDEPKIISIGSLYGTNTFSYCNSNPIMSNDPSGYFVNGAYIEGQAACGLGLFFRLGVYYDGKYILIAITAGIQFQVNASAGFVVGALTFPKMKNVDKVLKSYLGTSLSYSWGIKGSIGACIDWQNLKTGLYGEIGGAIAVAPITYRIDVGWTWKILKIKASTIMSWKTNTVKKYKNFRYPNVTVSKTKNFLVVSLSNGQQLKLSVK